MSTKPPSNVHRPGTPESNNSQPMMDPNTGSSVTETDTMSGEM